MKITKKKPRLFHNMSKFKVGEIVEYRTLIWEVVKIFSDNNTVELKFVENDKQKGLNIIRIANIREIVGLKRK